MLKELKTNHKYIISEDLYYIIRESYYTYYIVDALSHILNPTCFECAKNYDSEYKLKSFLKENGVVF